MANQQASDVSASVRQAFNFSVDKFPLSGPDSMTTPWYGLFRSDTMEVVGSGSVTGRYVPHTTDDVCAIVDAAAEAFESEVDCKTHFRNGHFVSIAPTKEHRRSIFGSADNIWPRVMIDAGYNGDAFKASMGYWRDACDNMHIMRSVNSTTVRIRHTSGLRGKMNDLIQTFQMLKQSWTTLADLIQSLQNRDVSMVDFLDRVYGTPAPDAGQKAVTIHRNRTEAIFQRLYRERMVTGRPTLTDNFRVSAWEAFNAVQGYVQHESRTKAVYRGEFDRLLKSINDPDVYAAERLALELAA
jgi:hypothetical protein